MLDRIFFGIDVWALGLAAVLVFLGSTEVGFRLGRRRARKGEPSRAQLTTLQAAILGFLALVLGFTFSVSQSRFDTNRRLVVDEANAIGTTALRSEMLPAPYREQTATLLRQYAASRTPADSEVEIQEAIARSEELQKELWAQATAVARVEADPAVVLLFTESLNETIDLHSMRVAAYLYRAPAGLLLMLHLAAALAMMIMGYVSGLFAERNLLAMIVMVVLVTIVLVLIVDLERPGAGMLQTSERSLFELQESLGAPASDRRSSR